MNFQVQNSEVWHEAKIWISGNCSKKSPFISGCLPSLNPLGMSPAIQKSDQLNARTEKTKSKKSVAKSLTTDFHYISAEKRKNKNNKKLNRLRKLILLLLPPKPTDLFPFFRLWILKTNFTKIRKTKYTKIWYYQVDLFWFWNFVASDSFKVCSNQHRFEPFLSVFPFWVDSLIHTSKVDIV